MQVNIFYSWQSDLPNSTNRGFIKDCLEKAIKKLNTEDTFSLEMRIDSDTKGVQGTPDIAATIFEKIKSSQIFVADVTLVNEGNAENKIRRTPNPNVLVELGYAAGLLGWNNVILIYNTAYGKIEELPFDLRGRRPLIYKLSNNDEKTNQRKYLIDVLAESFQEIALRLDIVRDHPITKAFTYFNNKILQINWEVDVLISKLKESVGDKDVNESLRSISHERIKDLCEKVKANSIVYSNIEKSTPFNSWYEYLNYKHLRLRDQIKDLLFFYHILDSKLFQILTRMDTVLTDLFERFTRLNIRNENISVWSHAISELVTLSIELPTHFREYYNEHMKEYHKQYQKIKK